MTELTEGAVPETPLVTSEKVPTTSFDTCSEKVTVNVSGPAFTYWLAPARTMEETVEAVRSTT